MDDNKKYLDIRTAAKEVIKQTGEDANDKKLVSAYYSYIYRNIDKIDVQINEAEVKKGECKYKVNLSDAVKLLKNKNNLHSSNSNELTNVNIPSVVTKSYSPECTEATIKNDDSLNFKAFYNTLKTIDLPAEQLLSIIDKYLNPPPLIKLEVGDSFL